MRFALAPTSRAECSFLCTYNGNRARLAGCRAKAIDNNCVIHLNLQFVLEIITQKHEFRNNNS
nr:MAG TPA: hypothetical protein [Caudoviricetes sp.]